MRYQYSCICVRVFRCMSWVSNSFTLFLYVLFDNMLAIMFKLLLRSRFMIGFMIGFSYACHHVLGFLPHVWLLFRLDRWISMCLGLKMSCCLLDAC